MDSSKRFSLSGRPIGNVFQTFLIPKQKEIESERQKSIEKKIDASKALQIRPNPFLYRNILQYETSNNLKSTCLLLIDPQNGFCEKNGALFVPGANEDCIRFSKAFSTNISIVNEVIVTLDTHQQYHIAHSMFWEDKNGQNPTPFTIITFEEVKNGKWKTSNPLHQRWALHYVKKLEEGKRFALIIWPEHCLIGSHGHAVQQDIFSSLLKWEKTKNSCVKYVLKGHNAFTEHYSAFQAEVIMDDDPNTFLNLELIQRLKPYQKIIISGQALSHCVNFSVRDLVHHLTAEEIRRIVIIEDCSSSVKGFEKAAEDFVKDMKNLGVKFAPAKDVFI